MCRLGRPQPSKGGRTLRLAHLWAYTCASFSWMTADCSRTPYLLQFPSYLIATCHKAGPLSDELWSGEDGAPGQMELTRTHVASCDRSTFGSLRQQPLLSTRLRLHPLAIAISEILLQLQRNQWREGHRCELASACI